MRSNKKLLESYDASEARNDAVIDEDYYLGELSEILGYIEHYAWKRKEKKYTHYGKLDPRTIENLKGRGFEVKTFNKLWELIHLEPKIIISW